MYRTCLHCHGPLGENQIVEHFPVGKRLAYDAAKGRLWVVCPKCQRWNLTPLEERWEAIEECEREFERTGARVSTDNIVLARVRGGLDLVRVGAPAFPEFAAWRYGRILYERWRQRIVPGAALMGSAYLAQALGTAGVIQFPAAVGLMLLAVAPSAISFWRHSRVRVLLPGGRAMTVSQFAKTGVRIEPDAGAGWAISLPDEERTERATGLTAVHALRGILTAANMGGGNRKEVDSAIGMVSALGAERYVERLAAATRRHAGGEVRALPRDLSLALEMALHDDAERAAMAGELGSLRDEWQLAEEVAAIADDMFLPGSVLAKLQAAQSGKP